MAQTFRTDPDTGRTVISQDNVVGRQMASGERVDNRISDGGATVDGRDTVRRGYESMNAPTRAGTGYMSRSEFEAVSGMTDTNPYGNDGFFSRVFGIDPSKIDYTSNLGPQGIENVKIQAYDRFVNPFAQVDAFDRPTMGASFAQGTTRSGVHPGDLTIFGPAAEGRTEGIGALIGNALGFNMNPTIIPGTVGSDARSQDRGIYDFEVPENMDQLVSAALREDAIETRDPAAVPEVVDREIFTTDPEERNLIEEDFEVDRRATAEDSPVSRGTVPESTYRPIFTDDVTVADVIAAAPMATAPVAGSVLVNSSPTVTTPETENQRIMRERQEAFDAALRRRQQESAAFVGRTNETLDEILRRGDTIVTPGLTSGASDVQPVPVVSDVLSPENIRSVLGLPDPNAPADPNQVQLLDMIPPPVPAPPSLQSSSGSRINEGTLAFIRNLEESLARQKAMR